jgi:hypothetical protein
MIREFLEKNIQNYNGNSKVIGVLKSGEEVLLAYEGSDLGPDELIDFSTGMKFKLNQIQSFKNYSGKFVYSKTKNHHILHDGSLMLST